MKRQTKVSLAESRGSSSFLWIKVVSIYHFGRNWNLVSFWKSIFKMIHLYVFFSIHDRAIWAKYYQIHYSFIPHTLSILTTALWHTLIFDFGSIWSMFWQIKILHLEYLYFYNVFFVKVCWNKQIKMIFLNLDKF